MLDIKLIRDKPEEIKEMLKKRQMEADIEEIINLDRKRVKLIQEVQTLRVERNKLKKQDTPKNRRLGKKIKEELRKREPLLRDAKDKLKKTLWDLPNLVSSKTPVGKDDSENKQVKTWGVKPKFDYSIKDHLALGKDLDLIDFETGAKVAGSQFYFLKNEAVLLEFALIQYALNFLIEEGFLPVITPDLAKSRYYLGTGYLPKGPEAQIYTIDGQDLGLIATAEITLAGIQADQILKEDELPKKYVGYSHCYRFEAGGYGQYSRGLYRVHQFSKVEMFIYSHPLQSDKMHKYLLNLEEKIYQGLKIPYRVLEMCTGDLGHQAARKFDIEAWMPGRGDYGEVTSTSNCLDYQATRLNIKMRKGNGTMEFVHMLNGTAIATSRAIIAILENYQQKDGSVIIPEVLRPYIKKEKITR